jgi:hypothetical protein
MILVVNLQTKEYVKIYIKSKKKHSIYIMKVLILLLIIILCIIIFKSKYEKFANNDTGKDYEDIVEMLKQKDLIDDEIRDKLNDYKLLKDKLENTKIKNVKDDIIILRERYENTRIQLENILFNKFRPNRLDFNNKQQQFKLKLNTFIDELNGTNLKITNYGHLDKETCTSYPQWMLPDNVPAINNTKKPYFDVNTKCCTSLGGGSRDSCIKQYKKNIDLYNKYKFILKNGDNKQLELNKIEGNIYIVNLNTQIIEFIKSNDYKTIPIPGDYKDIISDKPEVCFKLIEMLDLNHLNQYLKNETIKDNLFEYPLYLITPLNSPKDVITIHNDIGEQLSIEPLNKQSISKQIFYKN